MANPKGKKSYLEYGSIENITIINPETNQVLVSYSKEYIPPGVNSMFMNILFQVWNGCIYINNKIYPGIGGQKTYSNCPETIGK